MIYHIISHHRSRSYELYRLPLTVRDILPCKAVLLKYAREASLPTSLTSNRCILLLLRKEEKIKNDIK